MDRIRLMLVFTLPFSALDMYRLPTQFDLRNVSGKNLVSAVKKQSGGTCWTHGTMSALEGNLLVTGAWSSNNEVDTPNLAEYHLDWWNGFNANENADASTQGGGLTVHQGGDYRVAAAYFARGAGSVRDIDGQSYTTPPAKTDSKYHYYYPRHIEWYSAGSNLENINQVKQAIQNHGVIGTALAWDSGFYNGSSFYQPSSSSMPPNHAVSIVGWDDNKQTAASQKGAWLVKNSWGTSWGDQGYFWISYYDKTAAKHAEMGAVSFRDVERQHYDRIYSHDYHGWRDTKKDSDEVFNAFVAKGASGKNEVVKAVSFYTAAADTDYSVKVYRTFDAGVLTDLVSIKEGTFPAMGFHTVDLNYPVTVSPGEKFYVYVWLSTGGHPYDKTSNVPVLLGGQGRPTVESKASPGESYFKKGGTWVDLNTFNTTANFTVKALSNFE